ncbi:MAG: TonB-dependent receptor [Fimbriimonadaceae bacterium]|nr:TonB-dependent receptor [Chitinophagales bacterium]
MSLKLNMFRWIFLFILLSCSFFAQTQTAFVYGIVTDNKNKPLEDVQIIINGENRVATTTFKDGSYGLNVPINDTVVLVFKRIDFKDAIRKIRLTEADTFKLNVGLTESNELNPVVITETRRNEIIMQIPIEKLEYIPDPTGDPLIAILKRYVVSNNELSSQYSVRGGNYDENLVYVNDFEIYRPLLIRSGQQEGLPFPNYDLISDVGFSAGGFDAQYGDKLSSVLDIQYKKPKDFEAGITASLLGASFYFNNGSDSARDYYLFGARYKTNKYLLNALSTEGQYEPVFFDVQGLYGINFNKKSTLEILGNFSSNSYKFIPQSAVTSTGIVNYVVQLQVFFEGQEVDKYLTGFGGVSYQYRPDKRTGYKFLLSTYRSLEEETFDVIGDYWLGLVETNLGDENFGEANPNYGLGVGTFQNFARNYLESTVSNIAHEGYHEAGAHYIQWGARAQYEYINDQLKEWELLDSAGYSLPYTGEEVLMQDVLRTEITLESQRYNAFIQDSWTPGKDERFTLTGGVRSSYWTINKEITVTPRIQFAWKPELKNKDSLERDVVFKAATGLYYQPPFYRELRNSSGEINKNVLSQKSAHVLIGADYNFIAWNREFKFVTEIYYKYLWDIVPYDVENVRITYFGENKATGYATGIDMRLFGEIVDDADSWISLSVLRTKEDIEGDSTFNIIYNTDNSIDTLIAVTQGYIPRPTDQLINFGMFFQDYMPGNKNFKVNLSFLLGTGLPFGPPGNQYYRNAGRVPPYRRVDIGFSYLLLGNDRIRKDNVFKQVESMWAGIEVFNLLGVQNTISYIWVKDISNTQYAFPNFLTDRRLNVKLVVKI